MRRASKSALWGIAVGIGLLIGGCAPAHEKITEQYLRLPMSGYQIFKRRHPSADPALLRTFKSRLKTCYLNAANQLGKNLDWPSAAKALDQIQARLDSAADESLIDEFSTFAKEWSAMEAGQRGSGAKDGARLVDRWVDAATPCYHQATDRAYDALSK